MNSTINQLKQPILSQFNALLTPIRQASKKTGGSTRNSSPKVRPKHRGIKLQDGRYAHSGNILVTQRTLRFHPGLNVGLGRNGTLFAMEPGRVVISCEQADLDWTHTWVQRCHGHRKGQVFYKKYFNVITKPEHRDFKLIDMI